MRYPTRLPLVVRRGLGVLQYAGLSALGGLSDRSEAVYHLDATLSLRRLHRRLDAQEAHDRADVQHLRWSEGSTFSQNGEDGVIDEIMSRIGVTDQFFVEVGASDGQENCTRGLLEQGWSGVWVEADQDRAALAATVGGSAVTVVARPVFRSDVADQLARAGVPPAPDVLVVDIDSDDLGVLASSLRAFHPRLVVVEYNAAYTPAAVWATHSRATAGWDGTFRHGASLGALHQMASTAGYQLVHCDSRGVNAFFVRADLCGDQFPAAGRLVEQYRVAAFTNHGFGHPRGRQALAVMQPLTIRDLRLVTVENLRLPTAVPPGAPLDVAVTVCNQSDRRLTSGGPHALNLSLRWVRDDEAIPPATPRTSLARPIRGRSTSTAHLWVPAPTEEGPARLRATVVCEGVYWREDLGGPGAYAESTVTVGAR